MDWVGLGMHNCMGFVDMWCRTVGKKPWVCNRYRKVSRTDISRMTGKPAESCRQDKENDKQVSWKPKDCMHIVKIFKELKKLSQVWKWRLKELNVFFMYCRGIVLWKYHLHWKRLNFCWKTQKINNIPRVQFRVNLLSYFVFSLQLLREQCKQPYSALNFPCNQLS